MNERRNKEKINALIKETLMRIEEEGLSVADAKFFSLLLSNAVEDAKKDTPFHCSSDKSDFFPSLASLIALETQS